MACLAERTAGIGNRRACRATKAFYLTFALLTLEQLAGRPPDILAVPVGHSMGIVTWIVAERRSQCCEVPQRVGVARATGGDRVANERTFVAEVVEVNGVVFMLADPRARLVM